MAGLVLFFVPRASRLSRSAGETDSVESKTSYHVVWGCVLDQKPVFRKLSSVFCRPLLHELLKLV